MALKNCPECNHSISSYAESCPHCGYPFNKENKEPPLSSNDDLNSLDKEALDSLPLSKYNIDQIHNEIAHMKKRSIIRLITPLLWIIIPTVALIIISDWGFLECLAFSIIIAGCANVALLLYNSADDLESDLFHYSFRIPFITAEHSGFICALIGIGIYIGSLLGLIWIVNAIWGEGSTMQPLVTNTFALMVLFIPYSIRFLEYSYYKKMTDITSDKPKIAVFVDRFNNVKEQCKSLRNTFILVFAAVFISVILIGVILYFLR